MLQKLSIKGEIYFFLKLWAYSIIAMPLIAQSALDTMFFLAVQYCWDCSMESCLQEFLVKCYFQQSFCHTGMVFG